MSYRVVWDNHDQGMPFPSATDAVEWVDSCARAGHFSRERRTRIEVWRRVAAENDRAVCVDTFDGNDPWGVVASRLDRMRTTAADHDAATMAYGV